MVERPFLRKTYAEIHLDHLRHNSRLLRSLLPPEAFYCPMVKADAYGHGAADVVKALYNDGVEHFGLAMIEEGIELRELGVDRPRLLVFGHFDETGARYLVDYDLTPVVWSWAQLKALEAVLAQDRAPMAVHLKFNTGMNRLGFAPGEADRLAQHFRGHSRLRLEGIGTHLSDAEDSLQPGGRTAIQIERFAPVVRAFADSGARVHVYNSSGLIGARLAPGPHPGWGARPGIALYGIRPDLAVQSETQKEFWQSLDLKPVMRLRSEVVTYHRLQPGERVSYGGRWTAQRPSTIGVLSMGYADGYHRILSNAVQMTFRGKRVPVTGTICMDYTLVDLTDVLGENPGAVGEPIVVFGHDGEVSVSELAREARTIPYELLTTVGRRVPRKVLKG